MSSETDGSGIVGQQGLNDDSSEYNGRNFQIEQALGRIGTIRLVKIMGVKSAGELAVAGFVDIKFLVNLVDGLLGSSMEHSTIFNVPYVRVQGGKNAIIMDPVVGDIGLALISDRDISTAKQTKKFANPGSFRRFQPADSIYLGGILNEVPEQYIQFNSDGVTVADKNGNKLEMKSDGFHFNKKVFFAEGIDVTGLAILRGGIQLSGTVTAIGGGVLASSIITSGTIQSGTIILSTHRHTGVATGGGISTGPTP